MEIDFLILVASIMFFSSFVQGSIGFGFPLVTTTFLALFTDIQTAIFFTLIPSLYLNVMTIRSEGNFWKAVKNYYFYALLTMLGVIAGLFILLEYETPIFKVLLALMIYVYLFFKNLKLNLSFIHVYPKFSMFLFAITGGIIGGMTNAIGPVFLIYALESKFSRAKLIQMGNVCFLSMKFIQIALFAYYGKLMNVEFSFALIVLLGVALFFNIGKKVRDKIQTDTYTKIIRIFLFCIATILIFKSITI